MAAETIPQPPPPFLPRYGEASLADVLPSLLSALDAPGFGNPLGLVPARRACLLLLDGLGHELLLANASHAPFLAGHAAARQPLTTGFPSTTAASLGSIGTGLPPGEHGLVGYTMRLPGMDRPVNCLRWTTYGLGGGKDLRDRFAPEVVQPSLTAFELATNDGIEVTRVGAPEYARSGLTRAVLRGGAHADAYSLGDLAAVTAQRLAAGGGRAMVYAYHADLDVTGHIRGPDSEAWRLQLAQVDRLAIAIAERLPRDSLLVVTGDHGMVTLQQEHKVDPADHPELLAGVSVLAGEARARHVHTRPGATADVLAAWRELLGGSMWLVTGEQAIADGWFGPRVSDTIRARIGDVVAAAFGQVGVVQREVDPAQARMLGHHGSMTPAEQLVPCVVIAS